MLSNSTYFPAEGWCVIAWVFKWSRHSLYFPCHSAIVKASVKLKSSIRLSGQRDNKIMVLELEVAKGTRDGNDTAGICVKQQNINQNQPPSPRQDRGWCWGPVWSCWGPARSFLGSALARTPASTKRVPHGPGEDWGGHSSLCQSQLAVQWPGWVCYLWENSEVLDWMWI